MFGASAGRAKPTVDPREVLGKIVADLNPDREDLRQDLAAAFRARANDAQSDLLRAWVIDEQLALRQLNPLASSTGFRVEKVQRVIDANRHLPGWRPIGRPAPREFEFRMGCVESIALTARSLEKTDLQELNPIRSIRLLSSADLETIAHLARFHHLTALDLTSCSITDLWLENLVEQPWSQSIRWLSLNRNPAVTARGVETLALGLPKLQFASMNGVGNDPIASDEGYLPALGEALEVKAKREIVWLRRKFWIAGVIPPTPLQFLDLRQSQGAASFSTGVF